MSAAEALGWVLVAFAYFGVALMVVVPVGFLAVWVLGVAQTVLGVREDNRRWRS